MFLMKTKTYRKKNTERFTANNPSFRTIRNLIQYCIAENKINDFKNLQCEKK